MDVVGIVKPEKHKKRLEANKKSAQASRERKKVLKSELELKVQQLSEENRSLGKEIIELETENKVLKSEFIQLQRIISQAPAISLGKTSEEIRSPSNGKITHSKTTQGEVKSMESNCPPVFSAAAFMYLVIVLQSFSQHFTSLLPESKRQLMELSNTHAPITVR